MEANGDQPIKLAPPEVLQHVKSVVNDTVTPSWLNSVPSNFGDAAAGTLKADEWRTMFTVYIPIALVSLWGEGTTHPSPNVARKLRDALDHTMALVSAITIACMRTMTRARATSYRSYIARWVQDLKKLYPDVEHRTNNHMALHIYDFLLLFGPVHSWWCFPFERLIGQLQHLPHNHKFGWSILYKLCNILIFCSGKLEPVMLQSFIKAARLRRWLARLDCPPVIKACKALFDKAYAPKRDYSGMGTHNDDVFVDRSNSQDDDHRSQVLVPPDLRPLVATSRIVLRARLKHNGLVYARSSTHLGNSLIYFYPRGDRSSPLTPGSVKYIFDKDGQTAFAVQRHLDMHRGTIDPFAPYPDFPAKLYSSTLSDHLEFVEVDWVFSHFARWQISPEHVVVLSLSKVSAKNSSVCMFSSRNSISY